MKSSTIKKMRCEHADIAYNAVRPMANTVEERKKYAFPAIFMPENLAVCQILLNTHHCAVCSSHVIYLFSVPTQIAYPFLFRKYPIH